MPRCKIVAEIGINHNGSLDIAKKLIDVATMAGCDFVKFQKRTVPLVYTKGELDVPRESPWGTTNRDQKMGLEFSAYEYAEINTYCKSRIPWFASPWDANSLSMITDFDIPYVKVPSALITNMELLDGCKSCSQPIILSTGMSTKEEVDKAVRFLGGQVEYILACISTYPTHVNEVNLEFIRTLKDAYPKHRIGFSNHFPGIIFMVVAVAFGAEMLELHVTLDRSSYGSDQAASIEPTGVLKICKYVRDLELAMGSGEWTVFKNEKVVKKKLRR